MAIAGGHVAVLLNRLKLFDIAGLLGGRAVFAWAAGAMAVTERVVLFHDAPPQGRGVSQVLEEGLGLAPGLIALPSPRQRLRLDDHDRVGWMARRYAPALCVALDDGARVTYETGVGWGPARAALRLDGGGDIDTGWAAEARHPASSRRGTAEQGSHRRLHRVAHLPIVEGTHVPFVYRGEGEVTVRHFIYGLPSSQPMQHISGTDVSYTTVEIPKGSRVEYKLQRGGEFIEDPLNPLRARDPFGANSVVHPPGYEVPDWIRPDPEARAGTLESTSTATTTCASPG